MRFAELLVKSEIPVPVVHYHRMAKPGEMETDLVHSAGFHIHANEAGPGQFPLDPVAGQGSGGLSLTSRDGKIDAPFLRMNPSQHQGKILLFHFSLLKSLL